MCVCVCVPQAITGPPQLTNCTHTHTQTDWSPAPLGPPSPPPPRSSSLGLLPPSVVPRRRRRQDLSRCRLLRGAFRTGRLVRIAPCTCTSCRYLCLSDGYSCSCQDKIWHRIAIRELRRVSPSAYVTGLLNRRSFVEKLPVRYRAVEEKWEWTGVHQRERYI